MRDKIIMQFSDLKIGYSGRGERQRIVAGPLDAELSRGELVCLLGPNGSGKSTLIKTLAGVQPALEGRLALFNQPVAELNPKVIARRLSTVLTDRIMIGNLDVFTLVSFGRSPYTGWIGRLRPEDEEKVHWAIEVAGLKELAQRDISTLSDGERQKTMIARALAQDTDLILLDEPTAHLDLPNRVEIIRLLRSLAQKTGKGILLSTHELDLALKAADNVWLLNNKRELFAGAPEDLVLNGTFEAVFERDSFDFDRSTGSFNLHQSSDRKVSIQGDTTAVFWTKRALEREGFEVVNAADTVMKIEVYEKKNDYQWSVNKENEIRQVSSIDRLITVLQEI